MSNRQIKPALDYEIPRSARELRIEQTLDGGVAITIPTRRNVWRFIGSFAALDIVAVVAAPVLWLIFVLFASKKPRAFLRLTPTEFILNEWSDDGLGYEHSSRAWPLADLGELRCNRYESGLWMTIIGRDSMNLLTDVPQDVLIAVSDALGEARSRLTP